MLLNTNFRLVDALQRLGYDSNEAITRSDRIMSKKAEDAGWSESDHPREGGKFMAGSGAGGGGGGENHPPGSPENKLKHHIGQAKEWRKEAARLMELSSKTPGAKGKKMKAEADKYLHSAALHETKAEEVRKSGVKL